MEANKKTGKIDLVVVCMGSRREFEARLEMGSWFGGKQDTLLREVVRGTERGRSEL